MAIGRSSVRTPDTGHTDTRTPDTGNGTEAKASDETVSVENWKWGDFAGWFRTNGCLLLWQGREPPAWASSDGRQWDLGRDLSILKQLHKKGEPFKALRGVIERTREPTCMKHFNQMGRWDYYYRQKAEWQKAQRQADTRVRVDVGGLSPTQ